MQLWRVYSGCIVGVNMGCISSINHLSRMCVYGREGWQLLLLQLLQTGGLNDKDKRICKNSHRHISL